MVSGWYCVIQHLQYLHNTPKHKNQGVIFMRKKLNITEGIFPMPVLMIATYNEDGSVNVMNAAWGISMPFHSHNFLNISRTSFLCSS